MVIYRITLLAIFLAAPTAAMAADTVTVTPAESNELFANPYMGWQSFYRPGSEDPDYGTIPSSVMYTRFTWSQLQPEPDVYDWSVIDSNIESAVADGQTFALRVSTANSGPMRDCSPAWLKTLGVRIHTYRIYGRQELWSPHFDDPVFLEKHLAFIKAMGERYNGRPEIALVDVGSVGLWGEWHMSGTDVPMPTMETTRKIIDAYREAFPDTAVVMQLDYIEGMKHALGLEMGWRVDCWGDLGGFSKTWCHMRTVYPKALKETGSGEAWKKAPVALETCWDMRRWAKEKWDLDHTLNWALETHATYINNKSEPVPEEYMPKIKEFLKKIGYRFVVRSVTYDRQSTPGETFAVKLDWENIGVAPCYADYRPAVALGGPEGEVKGVTVLDSQCVRDWLPGKLTTQCSVTLPEDFEKGDYKLLAGVVDAQARPVVRLAIEGRREDGWHEIGPVEVR